uniref:Transposase n=1 Tax=Streptomyces sp. NBC_00008 TaxID=2903610 RepID=A0AAU2W1D5_9ACTN
MSAARPFVLASPAVVPDYPPMRPGTRRFADTSHARIRNHFGPLAAELHDRDVTTEIRANILLVWLHGKANGIIG